MRATPTLEDLHFRLARYYLDKLSAAETAYQHGHEHSRYALALFDQEWPHIKQWRDWSAAFVDAQNEITALCQAYPLAGAEILLLRQHPQEHLEWLEAGLTAARRRHNRQAEMEYLHLLGNLHKHLGAFNRARDCTEQALALARQADNPLYICTTLITLGNVFYCQDEYERAKVAFEQALDMIEKLGVKPEKGAALNGLGNVAWSQSDYERAYEYFARFLEIAEAHGQPPDICLALRNLCLVTKSLGDVRAATIYANRSVELCRAVGNQRQLCENLTLLGDLASAQGNLSEARDYYMQSIATSRHNCHISEQASALNRLGNLLCRLGEFPASLECLEQSLSLSTQIGERWFIALALMNTAEVFRVMGATDRACRKLCDGLEIASTIQSSAIQIKYVLEAALVWHDQNRNQQAAVWLGLVQLHLSQLTAEQRCQYDQLQRTLEIALGQESFTSALERGKTLDLGSVIQEILSSL